jgi:hypothetical protein
MEEFEASFALYLQVHEYFYSDFKCMNFSREMKASPSSQKIYYFFLRFLVFGLHNRKLQFLIKRARLCP